MGLTQLWSSGRIETSAPIPATMRAVGFAHPGGPDVLTPLDIPVPSRIMSEVLVRVVAAGVNPIDAKTRAGGGSTPGITGWPAVPGIDFSGVVVAVPADSCHVQPGDEVFGVTAFPRGTGSYAEYTSVPSLGVTRKPRVLSHADAAALPVAALTAWQAVVDVAKAHEGQRMLIHAGAGGVGHLAVQFASYFGAEVTATCSASNVDWVRSLGARHVLDYGAKRFDEVLTAFDVVIDCVGDARDDTGTRSIRVLRPGGLLVTLPTAGAAPIIAAAREAGRRSTGHVMVPDAGALAIISRLITSGDVTVTADHVLPLEEAVAAHRLIETGHVRGKVVLKVSDY